MKRLFSLVAALCVCGIAGCGGSAHAVPTPKQVRLAPGHACDASNYAMQCALFGQPHPGLTLAQSLPFHLYGVDFAWGGPRSCSAMRSLGARFGSGYLSFDPSKNWTRPLVNEFHGCGIATTAVWETGGTRTLDGFSAGASDARTAAGQMAALGGAGRPITFAIDFDANGPEVAGYFQGCHSVLGALCNAYGGYRPLLYLYRHGLVGHWNWQTYAWSGGAWLPASIAPLEQYLNGGAFDNDRAIAVDFGQFPGPPVGPSQATIRGWRRAREDAFSRYHRHGCSSPQTGNETPASFGVPNVCRDNAQLVVSYQTKLWTVYRRWPCFGSGAKVKSEVCWIVRPETAAWSRARAATGTALKAHACARPYRRPVCRMLGQRFGWFDRHASGTVRAYS